MVAAFHTCNIHHTHTSMQACMRTYTNTNTKHTYTPPYIHTFRPTHRGTHVQHTHNGATHTHMYALHTHTRWGVGGHTDTCIHAEAHTGMHTHPYLHVEGSPCMQTGRRICMGHTHMHTHINIYIHTYIHTYNHTVIPTLSCIQQ